MNQNDIQIKSIKDLLNDSYFIPSYQRGYRWSDTQVKELLEDIWNFSENPPPKKESKSQKPFYCLQPIVVKKHDNQTDTWEVIDGQQRLTTISLILNNIGALIETENKNLRRLFYATREKSEAFLREPVEEDADINIDFYHIVQANRTIKEWFKQKAENSQCATPKAKFAPTFLTDTKVIWYEVKEDTDAYDIFTRLNIGKIQLTNAELIKALFLKKWNINENIDSIRLRQLQIATDWEKIEGMLQNDAFWYFIYPKYESVNPKYSNRIEYIFDLLKEKKDHYEEKYTFNAFSHEFEKSRCESTKGVPDVDAIWLKVKKYFLIFEDWYNDRKLYHLIGFLVAAGASIPKIIEHAKESTKTDFLNYLTNQIRGYVNYDIRELEYGHSAIKRILLLFNIQTIIVNEKASLRFPFELFHEEDWDIEHIRSQSDKLINSNNQRREWMRDMLEYFTGYETLQEQQAFISNLDSKADYGASLDNHPIGKEFLEKLLRMANLEKIGENEFEYAFNYIRKLFKEDNAPNIASIANLALLDATTNRSYGNAFFPIKRKIILKKGSLGIFIPVCTKNVFVKAYSKRLSDIMYWNDQDAQFYLQEIEDTLTAYLPQKINSN